MYICSLQEMQFPTVNICPVQEIQFPTVNICSVQEVYGRLEEPDGLAGIVRLRSGPARLKDHLLAAEKAGHWSEALTLYEQVCQRACGYV